MNYLIYSVEDDKNISHLINVALTKQGYVVESFFDGESFFKRFNEQKPNLILLDMMLPNIQGNEILKVIRDNDENEDIQIINPFENWKRELNALEDKDDYKQENDSIGYPHC